MSPSGFAEALSPSRENVSDTAPPEAGDIRTSQNFSNSCFYGLVKLPREWEELPAELHTLQCTYHEVDSRLEKLATGYVGYAYFSDQIHLAGAVRHMHFGVVNQPSEQWRAEDWAESVRTNSGGFPPYPDGTPISPSDVVVYRTPDTSDTVHLGRIRSVYRDIYQASHPLLIHIDQLITYTESAPGTQALKDRPLPTGPLIQALVPRLISTSQIVFRCTELT